MKLRWKEAWMTLIGEEPQETADNSFGIKRLGSATAILWNAEKEQMELYVPSDRETDDKMMDAEIALVGAYLRMQNESAFYADCFQYFQEQAHAQGVGGSWIH